MLLRTGVLSQNCTRRHALCERFEGDQWKKKKQKTNLLCDGYGNTKCKILRIAIDIKSQKVQRDRRRGK